MNKTLSIGLAGFSFMIEEHAYIKLSDYLKALKNSLSAEEAEEVMHDIEIRMVEIFKETLGKREVVNDDDVEKVIAQIGTPEQIDSQEEAYFSETKTQQKTPENAVSQKQLFRDPENAKLGGVCAGMAHYFGMDITWMRIIWIALAILGAVSAHISTLLLIFVYIILWIVLPQAKSASDFLKMKGEPMNFDNLKKESSKIVQFANESVEKAGNVYQQNKNGINTAGDAILNVFRYFFGGIFGLIGLGLLFSAIILLGASFDKDFISVPGNFQFYLEDGWLRFFGLTFAFLSVFIPSIVCLFLSIKLISPKTKLNYTGYVLGALVLLWFLLLGVFGYRMMKYKTFYRGENVESENVAVNTTSDTLFVDVKKVQIPQNFKPFGSEIYSDRKTIYHEDYPSVDIIRKEGDFIPYLVIKKSADGYNQPLKMEVPVEINDNKILVPNYFIYPFQYKTRDYDVDYELVVPKNKKVMALNGENGFSLNDDQDSDDDHDDNDKVNISVGGKNNKELRISTSSNSDSIIINGKRYDKSTGDSIIKKNLPTGLEGLKMLKDIDIKIKDGKNEISIKTK